MTGKILVVRTPHPDLPQNMRDRLELGMRNGMITLPSEFVKEAVLHMCAVLIERAEEHKVEEIIQELKELERASESEN